MDFYKQISLSLIFLVSTQIILCIILINDYKRATGAKLGPRLGSVVHESDFKFNNSKGDKIIVFTSLGCSTCASVIKRLQEKVSSFNNICIITKGRKEEVDAWKKHKNIMVDINNFKDDRIEDKYNITAFPYYIKITDDNKVSEKGILSEMNIIKLYKEVQK